MALTTIISTVEISEIKLHLNLEINYIRNYVENCSIIFI